MLSREARELINELLSEMGMNTELLSEDEIEELFFDDAPFNALDVEEALESVGAMDDLRMLCGLSY